MKWSFGDRLAAARKRAGFRTQAALGSEVGASRNTVAQWERDEVLPEGRSLMQLPTALGVSADWLLYGIEPEARSEGFARIAKIVDEVRAATPAASDAQKIDELQKTIRGALRPNEEGDPEKTRESGSENGG